MSYDNEQFLAGAQRRRQQTESADIPVVRQGYGRDWPIIKGLCPACAGATLFLGSGGYVTCARMDCPDPCAPSEALGIVFADRLTTPPAERECAPCSCDKDDGPHCACSDVHYPPGQADPS